MSLTLSLESLESRVLYHAGHDHPPVGDPGGGQPPAPHGDNPTLQAEHLAVMNLVKTADADHKAIASGLWSDPATWLDGDIPDELGKVWIPQGIAVTVDGVYRDNLKWIRDDGVLRFDPGRDTGLRVDTLIVTPTGRFEMGTEAAPILPTFEAKVIFADTGAIDSNWDPRQFSRGLVSHGEVSIFGSKVTSFVPISGEAAKGTTTLTLAKVPEGWHVGDRLILTGTDVWKSDDDEELKLVSLSGTRVTFDKPLAYKHAAPDGRFNVYLANVSRNAVLESDTVTEVSRRGHVMFMHSDKVRVENVGFYGLGRTDKRTPIDDPEFLPDGSLEPKTGSNPRGRYAVHFHRAGLSNVSNPAVIRGSAVVDSPGWGLVNHSSNVLAEDNVSFDVVGAHYATEAGDEIGAFRRNLAIKSEGSGDGVESRKDVQDFGHEGSGFWFQGAGVEVSDNVSVSQKHAGFIYFTQGLEEGALGTARFKASNLVDPAWANGKETLAVSDVPIRLFKGNESFGNGTGFESWFFLRDVKHNGRSVVEDFKVWGNRGRGIHTPYTHNMTFRNVTVFRSLKSPGDTAFSGNDVTKNIRYENVTVEGWGTGISMPRNGANVVEGGVFNNVVNIAVNTANEHSRTIDVNGAVDFRSPSPEALGDKKHFDIFLKADFNPKHNDITRLFNPDVIKMGTVKWAGKQLYYNEQAADFIPFPKSEFTVQGTTRASKKPVYDKDGKPIAPEAAPYVPRELFNKTNAQLFKQYGLAVSGIVAPASAQRDPDINGLVGDPGAYLPNLKRTSDKYTNQVNAYVLTYEDADKVKTKEAAPTKLRQGWNLLTRTIGGNIRTFLVYGDTINPTFQLDPKQVLTLNPADLRRPLTLEGEIKDDSFGKMNFRQRFTGLDKLPRLKAEDGSEFIVLTFKVRDFAKNEIIVSVNVKIDPNAPLIRELTAKNLPKRVLSGTLLSLLGFKEDR